jgi:thioredoxin-related protein
MFKVMAFALSALLNFQAHANTLGDDGLHKADWMHETFKDLNEDLADATAQGKRLLLIVEQRGCIYCSKMHKEVYIDPTIEAMLTNDFYVIQLNMFGDVDVTDFDGTVLSEKEMIRRWGLMFTPTMMFLPESIADDRTAVQASVVTMPGAFGKGTTRALLTWVKDHGYNSDEHFQKYLARTLQNGN